MTFLPKEKSLEYSVKNKSYSSSDLSTQKIYFITLDIDSSVEDIKERFSVSLDQAQIIAAKLGIKYPFVNGFSYVMATDFMVKRDGMSNLIHTSIFGMLQTQ